MELAACEPIPVSDEEFALFQRLIHREAGIYLAPIKRALLGARLSKRIRQLGLGSFSGYFRYVKDAGEEERRHLFDAISTNETSFFREPAQFEYLEREVIPAWLRDQNRAPAVRIWSAACSSGEEPFSIAMSLHAHLSQEGWPVRVVATDLSTRMLARAAAAEWPVERAAQIPKHYLQRYMLKGLGARTGVMKATPELRSLVDFSRANLNHEALPVSGTFDAIFCRNVLIYFDRDGKRRVIDRLVRYLKPGGLLFLGHAESGSGWRDDLVSIRPSICRFRPS